jgi:predicted 3-demethylubiquinone-9 3-methyltransferase (glyoxalase superfamily)
LRLQTEIDYFRDQPAADGREHVECGWLKDKFGMPWQIVPSRLWDWLKGDDPAKVKRVTSEVWQMEKLDLATLERAASCGKLALMDISAAPNVGG